MLRQARLRLGISLHEVEDATKIRPRYLADLERESFDALPAVYMQGSLKTYANFLGLDGEYMVRELKRRQEVSAEESTVSIDERLPREARWRLAFPGISGAGGTEPQDGTSPMWTVSLRWYMIPVLLLTLILAGTFVVIALAGEVGRLAISPVREPTLSLPQVYQVAERETTSHPSRRREGGHVNKEQDKSQDSKSAERPKAAEPARKNTGADRSQKPTAAVLVKASSSASPEPVVSAKPSPKPRPMREPDPDAPASARSKPTPQPSAEPAVAPTGGGGGEGANRSVTTGRGSEKIVVRTGRVRVSIPDTPSGIGPAKGWRTGGEVSSPEIPPLPPSSPRSPRIRGHQPAPATTPR